MENYIYNGNYFSETCIVVKKKNIHLTLILICLIYYILDITGKQIMPSLRFRQKLEEAIATNNEQITSSQTPRNEGHLIKINIKTLPVGLYFVKIRTNKGKIIRKFIKQDY